MAKKGGGPVKAHNIGKVGPIRKGGTTSSPGTQFAHLPKSYDNAGSHRPSHSNAPTTQRSSNSNGPHFSHMPNMPK